MEHATVKSNAIGDNVPKAVHQKLLQRFVYLLITFIGFLLIGFAAYVRSMSKESWVPELCFPLGVALSAPGILSYLYRRYLVEDIKAELKEPAEKFGVEAVKIVEQAASQVAKLHREQFSEYQEDAQRLIAQYERQSDLLHSARRADLYGLYFSRKEALPHFLRFLTEEHDDVLVVGSSLRGLLQEHDRRYQETRDLLQRMPSRVTVRFLLTHPRVADMRAQQENRRPKDIGEEIIKSLKILIDKWGVPRQRIKLYLGTPTCFGIKTTAAMLLNCYPYMKEALASPCLIVLKDGDFYREFEESHFKAWESALAAPVPDQLQELEDRLDEFAKRVDDLMLPDSGRGGAPGI
jgi:uncharacterized protein Yka (UPF0111/DUF47 family)